MMASYQNAYMTRDECGFVSNDKENNSNDATVTNLDEFEAMKGNFLSYFNFITSANAKRMKYFLLIAVASVVLILMLVDITSSGSTASVSPTFEAKSSKDICDADDYFKQVLKEEHTQVIGGMIKTIKNADRFEASGVAYDAKRDVYWVVFDSLHSIGKLSSDLTRNDENMLVHPTELIGTNDFDSSIDSDFEGIALDSEEDVLYLLTESVAFKDEGRTKYHSIIRRATYDENINYDVSSACVVDYELPSDNKGFEGIGLITIDDKKYFVGQCEGNHCASGSKGREAGNGRWVLVEFEAVSVVGKNKYKYLLDAGIDCVYEALETFSLPSYVEFEDYSDLSFKARDGLKNTYDVAVISQASSALWVGKVEWSQKDGPDFGITKDKGTLLEFPKRYDCETVFCNIEGVAFANDNQFVMVSDEAKSKGAQPWVCGEKDQAIHVFKHIV